MRLKLEIMKHQWLKIGGFVLAAAALPFLLSAAITTNQTNGQNLSNTVQTLGSTNPLLSGSPFLTLPSQSAPTEIIDNDSDNLAQVQAILKDALPVKTLAALRAKGLGFRAAADGRLKHLAAAKQPIVLSKKVSGAANVAKQFLIDYGKLFGLANVNLLAKPAIERDSVGYSHLRYQYVYKKIPVWGGEMFVHLNKDNVVTSASGKIIPGINLSTRPAVSVAKIKTAAIKIGQTQFKMTKPTVSQPKLYIYNKKYLNEKNENKNYLAYEINISDGATVQSKILIINAVNGQLINWFEGLENVISRQVYNCNGYDDASRRCYLDTAPEGFAVGRSEGKPPVPTDLINWCYDDAGKVHDYWQQKFNLDGANNLGGILGALTPIKVAWVPTGGGHYTDATKTISMPDTAASYEHNKLYHEYTHAVYHEQGPKINNYRSEDGAINEALADVFAIAVEQTKDNSNYDWKVFGRDIKVPSDILPVPASYYDKNFDCDVYPDPHTNGMVISHLAYLLSNGGKLEDCKITPIGFDLVQQILYLALKRLPNLPEFNDFYDAVNEVCDSLSPLSRETCDGVKYAMRVAQLDNLGICNDPTGKDKTKREELCDDKGDPIKEFDSSALCVKYGYNCGKPMVFDDVTGKNVEVDCDKCPGCGCKERDTCQNYKCVKCQPKTGKQACADRGYNCGTHSLLDGCGGWLDRVVCGLCPIGKICSKDFGYKCVLPKNIKGDGGMYDSSGKPSSNGGYYTTITIGSQTLFKDNLNGGAQIASPATQTAYQKYCWQNNSAKCLEFGGLYQWHTAMALPTECDSKDCSNLISPVNHRGICPEGFHVPTDGEWSQVEDTLKLPDQPCNPNRDNTYDCYNAGAAMRLAGDNDFSAKIFTGLHNGQLIDRSHFLSATQVGSFNPQSIFVRAILPASAGRPPTDKQLDRPLSDRSAAVGRVLSGKNYFYSLRCFADCELHDGQWSDWKPIGGCGEIKPGIQKQYRSCDKRECGGQACQGDSVREVACDPDKSCGGLVKAEGGPRDKYGRLTGNGGYYGTVQVGDDCWLSDNLNVGTKVINEKQRSSVGNGLEKWCYKNDAKQCEIFGGLYSWMEATGVYVDYTKEKKYYYDPPTPYGSEWLKGICPVGWKIPNNGEWQKFIAAGKDSTAVGVNLLNTSIRLDSGLTDIDNAMAWSSQGFVANDVNDSIYDENSKYGAPNNGRAMLYGGFGGYSNVWYAYYLSARKGFEGLPVRCIRSCEPINGNWSDWQKDGECGQYEPYMQRYARACSEPKCGGKTCEGLSAKEERCQEPANCGLVPYEGGPYDATGQIRNQGGYYRTVLVRGTNAQGVTIDQCWLRDNLNIGQLVGVADQSNNSITEKYCRYYYSNRSSYEQAQANCQEFGGLYQWAEAMKLSVKCLDAAPYGICAVNKVHRGICPVDWHIPSDEEWHQLELYYSGVAGNLITCEAERISAQDKGMSDDEWAQTNCAKAGYKLRDHGMSGLDAITKAFLKVGDGFVSRYHDLYYRSKGQDYRLGGYPILPEDEITALWTTKAPTQWIDLGGGKRQMVTDKAIDRFLIGNYNNGIYRNLRSKRDGLSVRCIKDPCITIDPNDPNYLITTHLGRGGIGFGVYNPTGLPYCETTPAADSTSQPGVKLEQSPTALGSQGMQLSQAEQTKYLQDFIATAAKGRSYTDQELSFINSPQNYLQRYGFVQAEQLLKQADLVAQ